MFRLLEPLRWAKLVSIEVIESSADVGLSQYMFSSNTVHGKWSEMKGIYLKPSVKRF